MEYRKILPINSIMLPNRIEEQVRIQMKKAYWDIFDEAIASVEPKPGYILGVFREVSQVLESSPNFWNYYSVGVI